MQSSNTIQTLYGIFTYNGVPYNEVTNRRQSKEIDLWILNLQKLKLDEQILTYDNIKFGIDRRHASIEFTCSEEIPRELNRQVILAFIHKEVSLLSI